MTNIAFEGIDFSGKDTQIDLIKGNIPNILYVQEPIVFREKLLHYPFKEYKARTIGLLADRMETQAASRAMCDSLTTVINNRSDISGYAYSDYSLKKYIKISKLLGVEIPDFVFIILLDPDTFKSRMRNCPELDRIESEPLEFHMRVQERMLAYIKHRDIPYLEIDGTRSITDMHMQIKESIKRLCPYR